MRLDIINEIADKYNNILGIVAYKNNQKIYEEYFNNSNEDESVHVFSVTKSVVSIIIGIAIDKGYIKSVNQKILDFFPNYKIKRNQEQLKSLTIKDLLTMTTPYKYKYEPYKKVFTSADWGITALDMVGGKDSIGKFHYSTIGIQILSDLFSSATGRTLKDFAVEYLFAPMGINNVSEIRVVDKETQLAFYYNRNTRGWVHDLSGYSVTGWGLSLTADEFAKIGLLCVNNGVCEGKQIVSSTWIKEMWKEHQKNYGYLWWIYSKGDVVEYFKKKYHNDNYDTYCASGVGGSLIYIVPSENIVISITSSFLPSAKFRMDLINHFLIPHINNLDNVIIK